MRQPLDFPCTARAMLVLLLEVMAETQPLGLVLALAKRHAGILPMKKEWSLSLVITAAPEHLPAKESAELLGLTAATAKIVVDAWNGMMSSQTIPATSLANAAMVTMARIELESWQTEAAVALVAILILPLGITRSISNTMDNAI